MNKVVIILGPTGVGKSTASILLAKELNTGIISADSMQIYKGMDIGTAKPTEKERELVKHYMIDIVDPLESYSAGQYMQAVIRIIEGFQKDGNVPLIVGGTGLYIKALTRGIFNGPSCDPQLRDELLLKEKKVKGTLYSYLNENDPDAAATIGKNDIRRIIRAIEVYLNSGEKISVLQKNFTKPLPYEFIKIGLSRERKELYSIIDKRVDDMMDAGLIEEAERVFAINPCRTPLQAIGYKEILMHLNKELEKKETVRLIKRNTRRYAKRQYIWFRKEEGIQWVDVTGLYSGQDIFAKIRDALIKSCPELYL